VTGCSIATALRSWPARRPAGSSGIGGLLQGNRGSMSRAVPGVIASVCFDGVASVSMTHLDGVSLAVSRGIRGSTGSAAGGEDPS
jgi:hypothetical protein